MLQTGKINSHTRLTESDTVSQIHTDSRVDECGGAATRNTSTGFPLVKAGVEAETVASDLDSADVGHMTMTVDRL